MNVALYARVSTRDKGQSTDNQLPDLRRYAAAPAQSSPHFGTDGFLLLRKPTVPRYGGLREGP